MRLWLTFERSNRNNLPPRSDSWTHPEHHNLDSQLRLRHPLLSKLKMKNNLSKIRHLALDMDGTIYKGNTLFDFTLPFLASLREMGIGYTFLTNNPSKSAKDY